MTTASSDPIRVALVGLGNIGFRHLQGLNAIAARTQLLGVDLSADNLARAKAEWKGCDARFIAQEAPADLRADVLILATSSQGRLALMKRWGEALKPRHIILEKVAFTRMEDFDAAARLGAELGASVHVNCPRRVWPSFLALREMLAGESGPITVALADPDLGLACNGVHIVDAFQFLVGDDDVRLDAARIDEIVESKRAGYKEAFGEVVASTGAGDRLTLSVRRGEGSDKRLSARRGALHILLDQASGTATLADGTPRALGRAPYQSELTGSVVAALTETGGCALPDLTASAKAHRVMIPALREAFERAGVDCRDGLPIT